VRTVNDFREMDESENVGLGLDEEKKVAEKVEFFKETGSSEPGRRRNVMKDVRTYLASRNLKPAQKEPPLREGRQEREKAFLMSLKQKVNYGRVHRMEQIQN
jgi:hypothetical protein